MARGRKRKMALHCDSWHETQGDRNAEEGTGNRNAEEGASVGKKEKKMLFSYDSSRKRSLAAIVRNKRKGRAAFARNT